ncbi:MAG: trypsin [Aeromicrobium sp.]|nr:trypsin [Aeromicrobium sp.]
MSDTHDPFADRPYVPPTEREPEADENSTADTTPQTPVPGAADGSSVPPPVPPTPPTATPEAAAEPPAAEPPAASDEPTIPAPASSEETTLPVPPVSPPPPGPPVADPASYTHRFPSSPDEPALAAAAAPETHTATFPAFAEPTESSASSGDEPPEGRKRRGGKVVAVVAVAALAGAAGFGGAAAYEGLHDDGGTTTVSSLDTGKTTNTSSPSGAVEKVAAKVLPSVVQINVKGSSEAGSGTGIIISSNGEILTNDHVVEVAGKSGSITVAFNDGTNTSAKIIGTDPVTDIAVIKAVGKSGLTPATLGSSADLKVGQEVVAIGSPFGLESTVTSGIISALNRPVTSTSEGASANSAGTTFPAVQTDAAINPGNSGGPLVDLNGNVVAINSAIRSGDSTGGEAGSIGLGFAIPIDLAKNVSKQLLAGKKVEHARIGVKVGAAVSSDNITGIGAEVSSVTAGGAGDKAGLKKGDIITAVNGHAVASNEALVASVRGYQPGEKITLTYQRGGKTHTVDVTLDSDGGSLD